MSLGAPRIIYGVHSITPYNRSSLVPYGILKVLGSANLALTSSIKELFAGSNKYSWAGETSTIATSLTCKVKAYPGFLFTLFLGASVTDNAADAAGTVSALTNATGTSCFKATTGIATVTVKAAKKANLKFGQYMIKVLTSTTVGIFLFSDVDGGHGDPFTYKDDTLQVTPVIGTLTIATTTGVDIDELGITITGGSGTIAMTVGDTCYFSIKEPSSASTDIIVGAASTTFTTFGADILAQKRVTQEMFEIRAHNVLGAGLPISLAEMAFSEPEIKMSCFYDSSLDRVFTIRNITPS